ncbi:hypothetical protein Scep_004622 [Stephania cephalantha]|uniref:Uncharacterized protein n=1 Tax=Stephania cephalantha TaxID=152367 RepID=A0AAP0PVL0_9MAGN
MMFFTTSASHECPSMVNNKLIFWPSRSTIRSDLTFGFALSSNQASMKIWMRLPSPTRYLHPSRSFDNEEKILL